MWFGLCSCLCPQSRSCFLLVMHLRRRSFESSELSSSSCFSSLAFVLRAWCVSVSYIHDHTTLTSLHIHTDTTTRPLSLLHGPQSLLPLTSHFPQQQTHTHPQPLSNYELPFFPAAQVLHLNTLTYLHTHIYTAKRYAGTHTHTHTHTRP